MPCDIRFEDVVKSITSKQDKHGWLRCIQLMEEYIGVLKTLNVPSKRYETELLSLIEDQKDYEDRVLLNYTGPDDVKIELEVPPADRNYDTWKQWIILDQGRKPIITDSYLDSLKISDPDLRKLLTDTSRFQWFIAFRELVYRESFLNEEKGETTGKQE